MTASTIAKIKKLSNFGALGNVPPPNTPEFRRHNLIYGFNGTGKTTLSRIFASLEAGKIDPELPEGSRFEIELSDGAVLKSDGDLTSLAGRILVFNADFQDRNLQWKAGTAKPVFIMGEQQAENVKKLEHTQELRRQTLLSLDEAKKAAQRVNERFDAYKRDAARSISEFLGLGRRYNATNLDADTRSRQGLQDQVDDDEVKRLQAIIAQDQPLPELDKIGAPKLGLSDLQTAVAGALSETIGQLRIQDFNDHPSMLSWVASGLNYHRAQQLSSCLFCGNDVSQERLDSLSEVINNRFASFSRHIQAMRESLQIILRSLDAWSLCSPNDVSPSVRDRFTRLAEEVKTYIIPLKGLAAELSSELNRKSESLNSELNLTCSLGIDQTGEIEANLRSAVARLNDILDVHNKEHMEFRDTKAFASTRLKNHYIDKGSESFSQFQSEADEAQTAVNQVIQRLEELRNEEEKLKREVRSHGPAANLISKSLQAYLGRSDIDISPIDNGYQLRRNGNPARGQLSEGEKTAIALCYFLSTVHAEARRLKNLIVVVDDPVSSLDTRSLNYSFNFIRSSLAGAAQLFILTHNLTYMNQVKKWLKSKSRRGDNDKPPAATLLFLEPIISASGGSASILVELPKHIRDYDSEYQYLFNLVLEIVRSPANIGGYIYVMPNALRKVLDLFLAFKLPGPDGLRSKVDTLAGMEAFELDPNRIRALESLLQVESHADDLEELVAFSSMTVEEIKDAADALLHLMEKVDGEHYRRLCSVCN